MQSYASSNTITSSRFINKSSNTSIEFPRVAPAVMKNFQFLDDKWLL